VAALTKGGAAAEPLAVDFAHFTDRSRHLTRAPALVVILPGPYAGSDTAWIVGPQCATAPDNNLYLFQSVPSTP
jgi:hypothetical protein